MGGEGGTVGRPIASEDDDLDARTRRLSGWLLVPGLLETRDLASYAGSVSLCLGLPESVAGLEVGEEWLDCALVECPSLLAA